MSDRRILERDVEKHLVVEVLKLGGKAYKFASPAQRGVPDRIVVLPGNRISFVELKSPTGRLSPLQRQQHYLLEKLGAEVAVLSDLCWVDAWLAGKKTP